MITKLRVQNTLFNIKLLLLHNSGKLICLLTLLIPFLLSSCTQSWSLSIISPLDEIVVIDQLKFQSLLEDADLEDYLPLERLLWNVGYSNLDEVKIEYSDGSKNSYQWSELFSAITINKRSQICIANVCRDVKLIQPIHSFETEASIIDIASTISSALDIPVPENNMGRPLTDLNASHVVAILLDGFGLQILSDASNLGLTKIIDSLPEPLLSSTVYPPGTRVATSAFLTGTLPEENDVTRNTIRNIKLQTLFSAIELSGKTSISIEGESLPVNLIDTEVILSGDRDGNGSTNDNVYENVLNVLSQSKLPDFLFIHFHGIDDAGHTFGIGSDEQNANIQNVDIMLGEIIQQLPPDTLLIIFADHGMHNDPMNPSVGTHGNLIKEDMLIPIIIYKIPKN